MPRLSDSTAVTFPAGDTDGISVMLDASSFIDPETGLERKALVVAETPFHPEDHQWPDQPGDTGLIEVMGHALKVCDTLVGAVADGSAEIFAATSIPVRRGEPGWHWLVLHVLSDEPPDVPLGAQVAMKVDRVRRLRLSVAHTACHLSGFALNAILEKGWRKSPPTDSLGNPDFDSLALTKSRIFTDGFQDTYRIGRTLRKQGFDRDFLTALLPTLGVEIAASISKWLGAGGGIRLLTDGNRLCDLRTWECDLPEGTARVACGGTHPMRLAALTDVAIEADLNDEGTELQVIAKVMANEDVMA